MSLSGKILDMLRQGPVTSGDLYLAFERDYSLSAVKRAMADLGEVHRIARIPYKRSASGLVQYRYVLLPAKLVEIR